MQRLVADIGGTHARFALADAGGALQAPRTLAVREHASLADAARAYLAGAGVRPAQACIAVAAPVDGDTVTMTNSPWSFSVRALQAALGLERLRVINDFEATAWAVTTLAADDCVQIGGGVARPDAPVAVLGAGTGLGVAQLLRTAEDCIAIATEGGHASIGPCDERELQLIAALQRAQGRVGREDLLSGPGIERIHRTLAAIDGVIVEALPAAAIQQAATAGTDARCRETLEVFCALLGTAAGDQALCCGARGGVYIAGGIVPRFPEFLRRSRFRARFEDKGAMRDYVAQIPVFVVMAAEPGLRGTARAPLEPG